MPVLDIRSDVSIVALEVCSSSELALAMSKVQAATGALQKDLNDEGPATYWCGTGMAMLLTPFIEGRTCLSSIALPSLGTIRS